MRGRTNGEVGASRASASRSARAGDSRGEQARDQRHARTGDSRDARDDKNACAGDSRVDDVRRDRARRKHERGPTSIGDALRDFLRDSGLSQHLRRGTVLDAWSRALGRDLARRARPVRFARGELCVEVDSAAHMHELVSFTGERYRELANGLLGKPEIQRVVFRLRR